MTDKCEMQMVDDADMAPTPGKRVDKNKYHVPVLNRGNGK